MTHRHFLVRVHAAEMRRDCAHAHRLVGGGLVLEHADNHTHARGSDAGELSLKINLVKGECSRGSGGNVHACRHINYISMCGLV